MLPDGSFCSDIDGNVCTTAHCDTGVCDQSVNVPAVNFAGQWSTVISCQPYSGTSVTGVRMEVEAEWGIYGCSKVESNVLRFTGSGLFNSHGGAVTVDGGVTNSDRVGDNYIDGWPWYAVLLDNNTMGFSVDHNMIVLRARGGSSEVGLEASSSTAGAFDDNVVFGDPGSGAIVRSVSSSTTFSDIYCDPNAAACESGGTPCSGCNTNPPIPFLLP